MSPDNVPAPTIGRIVHYKLTVADGEAINRRRVKGAGHGDNWPEGAQAHVGNPASAGQIVPAIVVSQLTNDLSVVNAQALLDGNDSLWLTSVHQGTAEGEWSWPPRA